MAKHYQVTKEINGKEYTAQFAGMSVALDAMDKTHLDGTDTTSVTKFAEYLLKHVIVEPKGLTIDDFDHIDDLNAVTGFAREVMQGNFREEANEGAAGKKG